VRSAIECGLGNRGNLNFNLDADIDKGAKEDNMALCMTIKTSSTMVLIVFIVAARLPSATHVMDGFMEHSALGPFIGTAYAANESNSNSSSSAATATGFCDCSVRDSNSSSGNVTLCHKPGTAAQHTISIGSSAEAAHLAHGDYSGVCSGESEPDALVEISTACTCADGSVGVWIGPAPEVPAGLNDFRDFKGR